MTQTNRVNYMTALCALFVAVGYGFTFISPETIEACSSYILYPVLRTQQYMVDSVQNLIRDRRDTAYLKKLLYEEHLACEALRAENIQLRATQNFAQDIQEIDAFRKQYENQNSLIVPIIFRHFSDKEHYFLIDAGLKQGVTTDMIAVYKNCLVGKVEQVHGWYSKVRLVTDAACKVAAYCANTKINGIYQGENAQDHAQLHYVSHFKTVELGDLLLSSGEGLIFPQGFSLGAIEQYEPNGLYHTIRVKPHIDFSTLSHCVLISKN